MTAKTQTFRYTLAETTDMVVPRAQRAVSTVGTWERSAGRSAAGSLWRVLTKPVVLLAIAGISLMSGMYACNGVLAQQRYDVQQVRSRVVALTKSNEALRLEVEQLKSPNRIQVLAETQLGMFTPSQVLYSSASANTVAAKVDKSADGIRD